jgi:hypothetical protein
VVVEDGRDGNCGKGSEGGREDLKMRRSDIIISKHTGMSGWKRKTRGGKLVKKGEEASHRY